MAVKITVFVFLYLITITKAMDYACDQESSTVLSTCTDNSLISVLKTSKDYKLSLCLDDKCTSELEIKCKEICDACKSLHAHPEETGGKHEA